MVGFPGDPFHWYENPKGTGAGHWKEHLIWHSICNESPQFTDLTGDGQPEFVLGSQPEQQMGYLEIPGGRRGLPEVDVHPGQRAGGSGDERDLQVLPRDRRRPIPTATVATTS